MKSVYSAVRTGSLNKVVCAWYLKGQNDTRIRQVADSNAAVNGCQV